MKYNQDMYEAFINDGLDKTVAMAFGNFFGWIKGENEIDVTVRARLEDIGVLTPENDILVENFDDGMEWILIAMVYEGLLERRFNKEKDCYEYKNTEKGHQAAMKSLSGKNT